MLTAISMLFFYTLSRPEFVLVVDKPDHQKQSRHAENQG